MQQLYKLASQQLFIAQQKTSDLTSNINCLNTEFENFTRTQPAHNVHKNPYFDHWFGVKNTASWRKALQETQQHALQQLFVQVDKLENKEEQIELLRDALKMRIFTEQVSNIAFWKTGVIKAIEAKLAKLENYHALNNQPEPVKIASLNKALIL